MKDPIDAAKVAAVMAETLVEVVGYIHEETPTAVDSAFSTALGLPIGCSQAQIDVALETRVTNCTKFDPLVQRIEELEDTLRQVGQLANRHPRGVKRLVQINALIERVLP